MVGVEERVRKLKRELETLEEIREAAKRWASRIGCGYAEPSLKVQYKVNAKAEQVLQANYVTLVDKCRKSEVKLLIAGENSRDILEQAKKYDLGEVVENYTVFKGSYKEAVELLRSRVKRLTEFSLAFLSIIPDVPHDGDICRFADYLTGLKHMVKEIDEAFFLLDEIYQTLTL